MIYTTLGCIVSLILLNLGRFAFASSAHVSWKKKLTHTATDDAKAKHVPQIQED